MEDDQTYCHTNPTPTGYRCLASTAAVPADKKLSLASSDAETNEWRSCILSTLASEGLQYQLEEHQERPSRKSARRYRKECSAVRNFIMASLSEDMIAERYAEEARRMMSDPTFEIERPLQLYNLICSLKPLDSEAQQVDEETEVNETEQGDHENSDVGDWSKVGDDEEEEVGDDEEEIAPCEPDQYYLSDLTESIQERIIRVSEDLKEIQQFYNIEGSPTRYSKLSEFYFLELQALFRVDFASYTQEEKVDFLLLKNFFARSHRNIGLEFAREKEYALFVEPFANSIAEWCEIRQRQEEDEIIDPQTFAQSLSAIRDTVANCAKHVTQKGAKYSQATGSRAARRIGELREHLKETFKFYEGYVPSFHYWVSSPWSDLDAALEDIETRVRQVIIRSTDDKQIVGEPIGRKGLLAELNAEMIPYTPEELLKIAESEYAWCEQEMKEAASFLKYSSWRDALEHVKNQYEPPETHIPYVRSLVAEGSSYVKKHDLVTVPSLAEETIRITRIPPSKQLVSPFFLGGPRLQVAYPREDMKHEDKMMTLRGNNRSFSRATAFHEMIPGHRLQLYMGARSRPYRAALFSTPFYVEGWALYWEMVLWNRGDFFVTPEDKIGTLFWRMHRCARITFSLNFHLGKMSAQECVELLVNKVGHERSTAEGEVRRSLNGSYGPLYQAGYMLGALQLMKLREEVLSEGKMGEQEFHDRVLKANVMPIEMLRALLTGEELDEDFQASWKFYGDKI
ncbi:hypothetical protein GGR57DRAFT_482339 [Xylariaceae sp. FL1272]|nr:hypothetical protein GGR57DRAFT_482339 [Xylariaceae sp. FL1272]